MIEDNSRDFFANLAIKVFIFIRTTFLDGPYACIQLVLFKAIDNSANYSESGIIDRKTGELVHEITKNIKSEISQQLLYGL